MNYKIFFELKENGFKQEGKGFYISKSGKICKSSALMWSGQSRYKAYVPIIDELLFKIDDEWFDSLHCIETGNWIAYGGDKKGDGKSASGENAVEALARLWLEFKVH